MIDREFQRGFVKLYALWRAAKGEVYGVQIIEEMRVLGFRVSPGGRVPEVWLHVNGPVPPVVVSCTE